VEEKKNRERRVKNVKINGTRVNNTGKKERDFTLL